MQCSGRQDGRVLEIAGLRTATLESVERCPLAACRFVLELEIFTRVGRFTATRATFMHPRMERDVGAPSEVGSR